MASMTARIVTTSPADSSSATPKAPSPSRQAPPPRWQPSAPETAPATLPASGESVFEGSLVDLFRAPHWTLLAFTSDQSQLPVIDRDDIHVHQIATGGTVLENGVPDRDGHTRAAYDSQGEELILIRPDGYIGARTTSSDATAISDYLARHLGDVRQGN